MKYIDTDKLKAEIERLKDQLIRGACASQIEMETNCKDEAYNEVLSFIDSLQQEQPEDSKGKFVFPKFLYARTKDNKTIYVSYAPQDMTAIEYVRNDSVEQEQQDQPGVDLKKREQFAINILCSLLQNNPGVHPETVIIKAVDLADNLMEKLYPIKEEE